jgi:ribokinase
MPRVTVVGSINVDLVATCDRLPQPGETLSAVSFERQPGGKGANQALACRRFGADVRLVGAVGEDGMADGATRLLREAGVDLSGVAVVPGPTGLALITVAADGENQIVVVPGANAFVEPVEPVDADLVLCQLEIPMDAVERTAATTSGLFCLNAAPAAEVPETVLERADIVIVNETEREVLGDALTGAPGLVVVTLGAKGAEAYRAGRLVGEARPPAVDPVDTVGAGDVFVGAFVTKAAAGVPVAPALEWACAAAALATTRRGAQAAIPDRAEVDEIVET